MVLMSIPFLLVIYLTVCVSVCLWCALLLYLFAHLSTVLFYWCCISVVCVYVVSVLCVLSIYVYVLLVCCVC